MTRLRTAAGIVALVALVGMLAWPRARHRAAAPRESREASVPVAPAVALAPVPDSRAGADLAAPRMRYVEVTLRRDGAEAGLVELDRLGARCVQEIDDVRGLYAIPSDHVAEVERLPSVAMVAPADPVRKIAAEAALSTAEGPAELHVYFHDTVGEDEARDAVERAGLAVIGGDRDGLTVFGDAPSLARLAADERVFQVWPPHTPPATHNAQAMTVVRAAIVRAAPYNLNGTNVALGLWDPGRPRSTHQELSGRVTLGETGTLSDHATHTAGTMISSGLYAPARGACPSGTLRSFIVNDGPTTYAEWLAQRLNHVAANNSWGFLTGWRQLNATTYIWYGAANAAEDLKFGKYTDQSSLADVRTQGDNVVVVASAGNERTDHGPSSGSHYHVDAAGNLTGPFNDLHGHENQNGGFDTITPFQTAKNPIVVGAIDGATLSVAGFSSWGPCDDGRLKPDVVAPGVNLLSTSAYSNGAYMYLSGTSMSSAVATGVIGLIVQQMRLTPGYGYAFGAYGAPGVPQLSMMKALLAHTATDLGTAGPDYATGYGLINAQRAVDYVRTDCVQACIAPYLRYRTLQRGQSGTHALQVAAGAVVRVTIAWSDAPGVANTAGVDDPTRALMRDLDLEIVRGTTVYQPWVLSRTNPSAPATRGVNSVDNLEQVRFVAPVSGTYTVRVRFNGAASTAITQGYSILSNHPMEYYAPVTLPVLP